MRAPPLLPRVRQKEHRGLHHARDDGEDEGAADDDERQRLLRLRADAVREGRRHQAERSARIDKVIGEFRASVGTVLTTMGTSMKKLETTATSLTSVAAQAASQANDATGSSEQAVFISQMRAFVSANREVAAALYWNSHSRQNRGCSSSVNNEPASLAALAAMGHSPGLQGHLVPPPR